jgi:hypothetical protein
MTKVIQGSYGLYPLTALVDLKARSSVALQSSSAPALAQLCCLFSVMVSWIDHFSSSRAQGMKCDLQRDSTKKCGKQ